MNKKLLRLICLILCAAMTVSLVGCVEQPPATEPTQNQSEPTTEPATEPPAPDPYALAREPVDAASDLTLRLTISKTTTVAGESYTEYTSQNFSVTGRGTDTMVLSCSDTVIYGNTYTYYYDEVFADGTLYVTVDSDRYFSGTMTAEECLSRYAPAVLVDASLYGSVEESTSGSNSVLTFTEPTAPESWAVPEDAELVDATGVVYITEAGTLRKTCYTVTYTYGPAEITLEVESYPTVTSVNISTPGNVEEFTPLDYVDAIRLSDTAASYILQSEKISSYTMESTMSQAALLVMNRGTGMDLYGSGRDIMARFNTGVYYMDYSSNQSESYEYEEFFRDGVLTITDDGAAPREESGVTALGVQSACFDQLMSNLVTNSYWENASAENLGSLIYVECTFTNEMGDLLQEGICDDLFGNPTALSDIASAYETNEVTGYFAVDIYTGMLTAAGYYYSGTHTIDGGKYELTYQTDQSFEAPSLSVYKSLTEEMEPETEPENKATPLFYHVTGPDGQEMWMLGTIHVGDERTAFLPQEIYDAFNASDALAVEFDSNAFDAQLEEDEEFSDIISDYYYYSDGTTVEDHVDAELYEIAVKYMKAIGSYNMNTDYLKPSIWANSIENFFLRQGCKLLSDKGMDNRLLTMAEEQGKEILDVESGEFQVSMMTGYSDGLQELLLKESISYEPIEYWSSVQELYELWCRGDEASLREEFVDDDEEVDPSEMTEEELAEYEEAKPYLEEYENAMSTERDIDMLEVAKGYLESGKTVFFAVGLAHLLEDGGLVDTLREAGYTVELVSFQ